MKGLTYILFFLSHLTAFSQSEYIYIVNAPTLNVRECEGTNCKVIYKFVKGDTVLLGINRPNPGEWLAVRFTYWEKSTNSDELTLPKLRAGFGYVYAKYLTKSKADPYKDWVKKSYVSGTTPDCENVSPEYDYDLENHLKIKVGYNTDVVVKMMKKSSYGDRCIRVVYVNGGDTFYMKNIPEGIYYLKIAYGKDYRQSVVDKKCYIKFIKNAQYEKGSETMDFKVVKTSQGISIPYFELFLDVVTTIDANKFKTGNISEADFNN